MEDSYFFNSKNTKNGHNYICVYLILVKFTFSSIMSGFVFFAVSSNENVLWMFLKVYFPWFDFQSKLWFLLGFGLN